jgi:methyl-accepting chemotaxis protein
MAGEAKENKQKKSSVSFANSVKTKLIATMLAVAIIPLAIAIVVSYTTSTNKAMTDAIDILEWEGWYVQATFQDEINKNLNTVRAVATSPSTIRYMEDQTKESYITEELSYLANVDNKLNDGSYTVLTGPDGMQVLRTAGKLVDVSKRPYFKDSMAGKESISDMIVSTSTGARQVTVSCPIYGSDGVSIIGIVQRNYDLTDLHNKLGDLAEKDVEVFVLDGAGIMAAHSQMEISADTTIDMSSDPWMTATDEEGYVYSEDDNGSQSILAYVKDERSGWTICASKTVKIVRSSATSAALVVVIVGIIMVVIAAVVSLLMAKSFVDPIKDVNNSLADLANGVFSSIGKHKGRKDEFGEMVGNTNSVIDTLDKIVKNIKESANTVALSSEELSDTANQISQTAEDVSNAVQEIASGATQQADEIQTASENVGRIGDAVSDVQNSAGDLSNLAEKMRDASEVSSNSLHSLQDSSAEMTEKIDEISKTIQSTQAAVNNISEKVEGITSIATQTNLLSLNASIEAARAGEAGKGFAVVAEEIGKLAEDSKAMADDIRKEMDILLEQATAAVSAAEDVRQGNNDQQIALGETLESVNGMLDDISNTVDGVKLITQGADTCEDAKNAVVDTMSALSAISEENAASAEETGASMEELSATVTTLASSANGLKDVADKLNKEMEFFK